MSDSNGMHTKAASMEQLTQAVVDPIHRRNEEVGSPNVISWLVHMDNAILPPWWSRNRDRVLRQLAFQSDFFQGAMFKVAAKLTDVPYKVVPRDPSIRAHRKQAEDANIALVEGSELGQGWNTFLPKFLISLWCQDNGAFAEIVGEGDPDGPIKGPALGLKVLDPARCTRTSNPIYPVIYTATTGRRFRFHYSRIIFTSQMPDPAEEMFNVGHCWLSRAHNTVQNLIDIGIYKQEKLGSRPQRQMIVGKGIEAAEIWAAFRKAELTMDAQGLRRYAKMVVVGGLTKDDDIESIDLTTTDGLSDEKTMTDIGVFVLAMTGGFPPRWIWPATTTGATKADAESQHLAGIGSGGQILQELSYMLGGSERGLSHKVGKFLPPQLRLVFDYQDDQEDLQQATNRNVRSEVWTRDIKAGVITVRIAREQMLDKGDLTESQFEDLELQDGRLPDGTGIEALFYTDDPVFRSIFGTIDPLKPDTEEVLASLSVARFLAVNPENIAQKRSADIAVKALEYLLNKAKGEALQQALLESQADDDDRTDDDDDRTDDDDKEPPTPPVKTKERSSYRLALVRNTQLLWEGRLTSTQFEDAMTQAVATFFPQAWEAGARECGIQFQDLTEEERSVLDDQIHQNLIRIADYADYIVDNNRDSGGSFTKITSRNEMWLNSYDRVVELAKSYACGNQKMLWVLGSTERHCDDCKNMAGRVYRMSAWNKIGIYPKSLQLACGGLRCDCRLVPTTKAVTRGRHPKFKSKFEEAVELLLGGYNVASWS